MREFTKRERKELRRLADLAYERELNAELDKLALRFDEWRAGQMSPYDLSDAIHEFHNGAARDLFVFYTRGDPAHKVARALAIGGLAPEELSADFATELQGAVEFYRELSQRRADEEG
jgi:hypothetical protein